MGGQSCGMASRKSHKCLGMGCELTTGCLSSQRKSNGCSSIRFSKRSFVKNKIINVIGYKKFFERFLEISVLGKYKDIFEISVSSEYEKNSDFSFWSVLEFLF